MVCLHQYTNYEDQIRDIDLRYIYRYRGLHLSIIEFYAHHC